MGVAGRRFLSPYLALTVCGGLLLTIGAYYLVVGIKRERTRRRLDSFFTAVEKGDTATVRSMLDADPLLANSIQRSGRVITNRPLVAAAKALHPDIVELLLKRGAPVNVELDNGSTALHAAGDIDSGSDRAKSARRVSIIELLLARGADVNARDDQEMTPLHRNAHDPAAVATLLAHRAAVNAQDETGATPLHYAAGSLGESAAATRLLLDHGAEVDARDHMGATPLHYAVRPMSDSSATVQLLLDHGAAVDARDQTGETPLLLGSRNLPILETLIEHGANVKVFDQAGRTALHQMAESPNNLLTDLDVLALLCSGGLRSDLSDHNGATPLSIARKRLAANTSSGWLKGRQRVVTFLSPGGACQRLATGTTPPTKEGRSFAVAEARCAENSAAECAKLGYFYESGAGVEVSQTRAASLYEKACKLGSQAGCTSLGYAYDQGQGVVTDPSRAASLYGPACEAGESRACFNLAILYSAGRGVAGDHAKSAALFRRACELGEPGACEQAGVR